MTYTVETVSANDMDRYRRDLIELLVDSVNGGASVGYQSAGEIPRYARSANGLLHTTVFLYKQIG